MQRSSRHLRLSTLITYIEFVSRIVLGAASLVVLSNLLSREDFGVYNFFLTALSLATVFTSLGIETVVLRFGAQAVGEGRTRALVRLTLSLLSLRVIVLLLFSGIFFGFQNAIGEAFNLPDSVENLLPLMLPCIVLARLRPVVGEGYFSAKHMQFVDRGVRIGVMALRAIAFLVLWITGGDLVDVLGIWLVTESIAAVVILSLFAFDVKADDTASRSEFVPYTSQETLEMARYGGLSWLSSFGAVFKDLMTDNLFIMYFLSVSALGPYNVAATLVSFLTSASPLMILRSILTSYGVKRYYEEKDGEKIVCLLYRSSIKSFLFSILPVTIILLISIDDIIFIFFPKYPDASNLFCVLGLGFLFLGATYAYSPILSIYKRMGIVFASNVLSVLNLLLNLILVQIYGILGVAIATSISSALHFPFYYFAVRRYIPVRLEVPVKACLRIVANCLPLGALAGLATWVLPPVSGLILGSVAGLLAYAAMSYFNSPFEEEERELMREIVGEHKLQVGRLSIAIP